MRIVVCDDDVAAGLATKKLLEMLNRLYQVCYVNFGEIHKLIEQDVFDFDILITEINDYDMKLCGIELTKVVNMRYPKCQVIYLTHSIDYAPLVYETSHCYFVIKSDMNKMLPKAIHKATEKQAISYDGRIISFLSDGHTVILLQDEIDYIERYDRSLKIHTERKVYHCYRSLKQFCEMLNSEFVRCHGSFIVNIGKISSVNNMEISLCDGTQIPIGNRFYDGFMKKYLEGGLKLVRSGEVKNT